jgi:DNA-directed RNA polymerase beta' subunit
MNMHMPQDEEARIELAQLALNAKHTISPANNSAIINLFQDSLLGAFQFTRAGVEFTPRQAMHLLGFSDTVDTSLFDGIASTDHVTNFEIISQILPPLSMQLPNKLFNSDKPDYNAIVEIINGKMKRGQTDNSIFGATSAGLIQTIHTDFGYRASSQFIDSIQAIVTEYIKQSAFSAGVSDLIADTNTKAKIIQSITDKKQQAKNIIDKVLTGTFENTTGKTNLEQFETEVNAILNKAQEDAGKLGRENLSKTNRFVIMVNAGSKGKLLNIAQMISCLGQQNVDGKRIPYGFENRTLPHYTKYDDGPQARGFVENSFVGGLTPQEMFFHAMGGRVGLIDTAVKSVSWETPIIIVENDKPRYTYIGEWIDALMKDNKEVKYETHLNMELLDIDDKKVIIPTMDYHGNVSWKPVTSITRHDSGDKLYKITTHSGRSVIVTASKSLLVWEPSLNEFREKYTADIHIGDFLPVTAKLYAPSCDLSTLKNETKEHNEYQKNMAYFYKTLQNNITPSMNDIIIDPIISIEDVPVSDHPKMYDLTIPETFNFALANGLQVRDTASTGYIQRKLVKGLEDLKVEYDMTVRNHKSKVIQFRYGDDGFDAMKIETQKLPIMKMTMEQIYDHFAIRPADMKAVYKTIFTADAIKRINKDKKDTYQTNIKPIIDKFIEIRRDLLRNVFGETSAEIPEKFNTPVHFRRISHTIKNQFYITPHSLVDITPLEAFQIINRTYERLMSLYHAEPNPLFHLFYFFYCSPKHLLVKERFNKAALLYLMEMIVTQYKKAIIHPGEMVGIVAAQSIGEPTTQLSLLRTERVKIIQKHKYTKEISVISDEIGTFCDKFINDYPHLTFNTGHKDSVETIIEDAEHEYYIPSVSANEEVQWTRISHVSRHIVNGDMVRVKTRSGREVHTTLAHSHLILKNNKVVPIKACDLTVGTAIPICGLLSKYKHTPITDKYHTETNKTTYVLHSHREALNMALYLNTKGIHTHIEDNIVHIKERTTSPIIWDEIVEIERYTPSQTEYVYDFTVPKHETFMTEYGIFVHNTLNTFHSAGNSANSNATRGVPRIEEIMTLTPNQKSSTTVIFLKPEEEQDQQKAKYIQHLVENSILRDIVNKISIHYDPDRMSTLIKQDAPLMAQYNEFEDMLEECGAKGDDVKLSKWILRIEFNKAEMLERNITMEDVHYAIQTAYQSSLKCIFSDYNAEHLVMRIHLTSEDLQSKKKDNKQKSDITYNAQSPIDTSDDIYKLKTIQENLLNNIVLKGIKGIKKVNLRNLKNKLIEKEGEFKESNVWVLDTMGTNLLKILSMEEIDATRTYSNNIREMYSVLGIEATRASIYNEFNEVMEFGGTYINYHHLSMLVDRMTINAGLVAIFRHDLNNDDLGPIAKASFEETPEMFLNASRYAELDTMRGVSANIMCGQEGYFGTSSFQLVLDIGNPRLQQLSQKKYEEEKSLEDEFQLESPDDKCAVQNIKITTSNVSIIKPQDVGKEDENYVLDF